MSKKVWVLVEVFGPHEEMEGRYWMDYRDPQQRACLGERAAKAIAEGGGIFTTRVAKKGDFP